MEPVSDEDANESLYFLDAFLDAVYVVPNRHRERQAKREAKEGKAQGEDSPVAKGEAERRLPHVE